MTDLETRLDRAFKADGPPARDPMFRLAVLERRERTALRRKVLASGVLAFVAAVLAALCVGQLDLVPGGQRLAAIATAAALLTALLAAPHLGGRAALRALAASR